MISRIVRCVGLAALVLALIVLNRDLNKTLDGAALHVTKVGDVWFAVHSTSLQLLQPGIERHVAEWLWDPVVLSVLTAPACLVFAILGAVLMLLGCKKKSSIGEAR